MKLNITSSVFIGIMVVLLLFVFLIYGYFRPYSVVQVLQQSIQENNVPVVDQYIDYPELKENFRRQVVEFYKEESLDNTEDLACDTVKTALDNEVIGLVIDQLLSLENLKLMYFGQTPKLFDAPKNIILNSDDLKLNEGTKQYLTLDSFAQTIKVINLDDGKSMTFIYRRYGLMDWRLSEIQMSNLENVVEFIKSKQADIHSELKVVCAVKAFTVKQPLPHVKNSPSEPKHNLNPYKQLKPDVYKDVLPRQVRNHLNSALVRACQLENKLRSHQGFSAPSRLCAEY